MDIQRSSIQKLLNTEISFGINRKQLSIFLRQFSALLKAKVSVDEALALLSSQKELKSLQKILTNVHKKILEGESLSIAFQGEKISGSLFLSMIRAGEETGRLSVVLEQLSYYYEREYEMKQKISQALAYPIILLGTLFLVLFFLFQNVLPTFVNLFEDTGNNLPISTRILIDISSFFNYYGIFLIAIFAVLIMIAAILLRNKRYRQKTDRIIFFIPFISKYLIQIQTGHMVRTLSILNKNAIPFLESLKITADGISNLHYQEELYGMIEKISEGEDIWRTFSGKKIFPDILVSMIRVGENTGDLGGILDETAVFYEKETEYALKSLVSILEPMLIIMMAVVIGYIVIAIATPMFDLINNYSF